MSENEVMGIIVVVFVLIVIGGWIVSYIKDKG